MKKVLALILAVIMLSSVAVVAASADYYFDFYEEPNWEAITNSLGMNIYIGGEMETSPIVNGSVLAGEYSYSRYSELDDVYNHDCGEIQSGVTEYFAHDADYVYYAVQFVQSNDNRAFQWQFRPFNSFDVYNDASDYTQFYYSRIMWQARYKSDDEGYWTEYSGEYAPTIHYDCVRTPEIYNELICESSKTYSGFKTYEVAISKAYLAEINGCDTDDIYVVPYFTYFHSAAGVGHVYTDEDINTLYANGATVVFDNGVGELGYRFIVLGEEPDNGATGGNAPTISVGGNATVNITTSGDSTRFKFVPEKSGTYKFYSEAISGYDCDPKVQLFDNNGNLLDSDDDGGDAYHQFALTYDFIAGEIYYFDAGCWSSDTGRYLVCLEIVHAEEYPSISVGETVIADITLPGNSALFEFVPQESGYYVFYSEGNNDTWGAVLNTSFSAQNANDDGGEGFNFRFAYYYWAGDTYYLQAKFNNGSTGSFYVTLERYDSTGGGDEIGGGEGSNNNDTHSSTTTTTTTTVPVTNPSKPSGGNTDKVPLTPKLSMTTLYLVPGAEYTLEVLNGDGVYQWSSSDPCVLIMGLDGDCSFIADGYGTSVITATSLTTGEVLACTVYVSDYAINFEWFERDEENKTLTLELDYDQSRFCFADVIVAFGDIDYVITTDKAGKKPIDPEAAISLKKGSNVYYIHVTTGDGESTVYKATIVRPGTEASKDDKDDKDDKKSKKGGCFSSISASSLLILPTLAGGVLLAKKRKED